MLNKKIVIADIDDTLVVHHQEMSKRTREIIDYIRSKGVYFGLASGRPLFQIMASLKDWNMETPEILVGLNGAQLYDGLTGKTYKTCELEKEWVKEAFDIMKPFKYTMYTYEAPDITLAIGKNPYEGRRVPLKVQMAENEEEIYSKNRDKLMFRVALEDMPAIEEWVKKFPSPNYSAFKTQATLMEFCPKGATKDKGLDMFCKLHNIDAKDVIAFGDMDNDIEMLKYAGLGVCLKNGSEPTKAAADVITEKTIQEDGWADFMDNHFLNVNE